MTKSCSSCIATESMSSTGHIDVSVDSEPSRRSTRERKQVEHFGHSEPTTELEELVCKI